MDKLHLILSYIGKVLFAIILFTAMIISTVVSVPFLLAGKIKDFMEGRNAHVAKTHMAKFHW